MTAVFPPPLAYHTQQSALSLWQRTGLMLATGWAALLLFFGHDTAFLADVYWNSSVYEHCIFILPVIGWLTWLRWPQLRKITPQGWALGLLWLALGMAFWAAGYGADINAARHLGLLIMCQGMFVALAGPNAARALMFPLGFSFFLVPLGDQLVMPLQIFTADMAMVLLSLSGITATLDGIFITTQAGYFRVAEACAGVNFLIATFVLGVLIAHLGFKSWQRRGVFIAASLIVPVLANGVRAWGTIIIAHYQGIGFAASFDHVFYGWFFFALVLALLMGAAWRFFDRDSGDHGVDAAALQSPARFAMGAHLALLAALCTALPGAYLTRSAAAAAPLLPRIYLPPVAKWQAVGHSADWLPDYRGADHRIVQRYRNAQGQTVDVFAALYARQKDGAELIAVNQGAVDAAHGWVRTGIGKPLSAHGVLASVEHLTGPEKARRVAAIFYHIGGETSGDAGRIKWLTLRQKLTGGDPRALAVLVSSHDADGRAAVTAFLRDLGPIDTLADTIGGR